MLDYGYAQSTSTESLKVHIFNEPITPASDVKTAGKKPRGNYGVFSSAMAAAGAAAGGNGMGAAKRQGLVDNAHARHGIHHIVNRCSPRHPPRSVPVIAKSSTT